MSCSIAERSICTTVGSTIRDEGMVFDVNITAKLFYYESYSVFNPKERIKKSLGNGMFISGTNTLVIGGGLEDRRVGAHVAYLRCVDQDASNIIFKWNITVNKQEVEDGNI